MPEALTIESIQKQLCTEIETLLSLKSGSVTPDTDLPALGISSLDFVSLVLNIEQRFGINLMEIGLKIDDTKSPRNLAAVIQSGLAA